MSKYKLRIKGSEIKSFDVSLRQSEDGDILVEIDGEVVATFFEDGAFRFHGLGNTDQWRGKWER